MPGMLLIEGRDKHGGLPWNATACGNAVVHLMDDLNLVDIYRQLHPRVNRLRMNPNHRTFSPSPVRFLSTLKKKR